MAVQHLTADATEFTANVWSVSGEVPTLVDAGAMPGIEEKIDVLDQIVLTHQHGDHVAELPALIEKFDPEVLSYAPHPDRTKSLADGDTVTMGDSTFEVIYTPGHADDHISLVSATELFSGDVLVYNDGAFDDGSFGRTDMEGQSRERLIQSLEELHDRIEPTVTELYPGHGDSYSGDIHAVIERALERARRREPKYPDEA